MATKEEELQKLIKRKQRSINSLKKEISASLSDSEKIYFALGEKLEEKRKMGGEGEQISDTTRDIETILDEIVSASRTADLGETKAQLVRLQALKKTFEQLKKNLSAFESKRLGSEIKSTEEALKESTQQKSGLLQRSKGFLKSSGVDITSILVGAAAKDPLGMFLAKIVGDKLQGMIETRQARKQQVTEDKKRTLQSLKQSSIIPERQPSSGGFAPLSDIGSGSGIGSDPSIASKLDEISQNTLETFIAVDDISKDVRQLVKNEELKIKQERGLALDTIEEQNEAARKKGGILERMGKGEKSKVDPKGLFGKLLNGDVTDLLQLMIAGMGGSLALTGIAGIASSVASIAGGAILAAVVGYATYELFKPFGEKLAKLYQDGLRDLTQAGVRESVPVITQAGRAISRLKGGEGLDYDKKLQKQQFSGDMGDELRKTADRNALEQAKEEVRIKRELRDEAFKDGSIYGSGKYQDRNGKPLTIDEASHDIRMAQKTADEFEAFLKAKQKKGIAGLDIHKFVDKNGKEWRNPLIYGNSEERKDRVINRRLERDQKRGLTIKDSVDQYGIVLPSNRRERISRTMSRRENQSTRQNAARMAQRANTPSSPSSPASGDTADRLYQALATPETGSVDTLPLDDPRRFIRTKAGSNSSAYGPVQITKSLMQGYIKGEGAKDLTEEEMEFAQRFVQQGKDFLNADYSDPTLGAGGQGRLNNPKDRALYESVSKKLIQSEYNRVGQDTDKFIQAWRGVGEEQDPKYYAKVREQLMTPEPSMGATQLAAASQRSTELSAAQASRPTNIVMNNTMGGGTSNHPPGPTQGAHGAVSTRQPDSTLAALYEKSMKGSVT